jgi:hypothetical protein
VKFVKIVLKLFDELEGISGSDKKFLTKYFIEGKTVSEIANINKSEKSTITAQIKATSRRLLLNFTYLNRQAKKAKLYQKNYEDLKIKFDFVFDQLNKETSKSLTDENLEFVKTRIIDLDVSIRIMNSLNSADIETVSDLLQYRSSDLLKFLNFGKKSLCELNEIIESHGFKLKK